MDEALQIKEKIEIDIKNMGDDLIGKVRRLGELNDQYKRTEDLRCYGAIRNQKEEILVVEAKMSKAKDYLDSINEILENGYELFKQQEELERDIPIPVQYC
jgi:phage host-nuclease inhibitor protein Gam